jgi:hypothetical protein
MSNKERPDRLVPQAARLGKRKRGSALIQAMNERDEALKAGNTLLDQHSAEPQESGIPQSSKEVQGQGNILLDQHSAEPQESGVLQSSKEVQGQGNILLDQHSAEPQESDVPQSGKEVQAYQPTGMNPPFSNEKIEMSTVNLQSHEEREKRSLTFSQEGEKKQIDSHENLNLKGDTEEKVEKVTFYITLSQLEKLEDMVYEYKKRTKVRRANRNDIIRILIDQCSIADIFK